MEKNIFPFYFKVDLLGFTLINNLKNSLKHPTAVSQNADRLFTKIKAKSISQAKQEVCKICYDTTTIIV